MANSSPATHQTLRQQGGTGEDGQFHLADWTFNAAAIVKNKPHNHAREQPVLRELFGPQGMASINNKEEEEEKEPKKKEETKKRERLADWLTGLTEESWREEEEKKETKKQP